MAKGTFTTVTVAANNATLATAVAACNVLIAAAFAAALQVNGTTTASVIHSGIQQTPSSQTAAVLDNVVWATISYQAAS